MWTLFYGRNAYIQDSSFIGFESRTPITTWGRRNTKDLFLCYQKRYHSKQQSDLKEQLQIRRVGVQFRCFSANAWGKVFLRLFTGRGYWHKTLLKQFTALYTKKNDVKQTVKPRVNGRNVAGCYFLRPFAHPVACCCGLLGVVAQSLKPVKLLATRKRTQQLPILLGQQCWELLCPFVRRFNLISKKRAKTVASWPSDRSLILLNH